MLRGEVGGSSVVRSAAAERAATHLERAVVHGGGHEEESHAEELEPRARRPRLAVARVGQGVEEGELDDLAAPLTCTQTRCLAGRRLVAGLWRRLSPRS